MPQVIIPGDGEFVELAATSKGRLFKKQILKMDSSFVHPSNPQSKVKIDQQFASQLVNNFQHSGNIVQFPMVNSKNQHVEDPGSNLGEVVDLTYDDKGVYATIDVRKHAEDVGNTILGASAMMSLNYTDTETGEHIGPTLLHVAATNRPYLKSLEPYEAVALSDSDAECVVLSAEDDQSGDQSGDESETEMDLPELLDVLKSEHGIDVAELQEQASHSGGGADKELVAALSGVLLAAKPDMVALSEVDESDISVDEIAQGVVELSRDYAGLSDRISTMESSAAEKQVADLVSQGRILPAQQEAMLELRLSDPEMFDRLIPEESIVSLSEHGVTSHEGGATLEAVDEAARLIALQSDNN